MNISKIYRKRLIPAECLFLKDDIIVEQNDEFVLTKWKTLHPKPNFSHGCSCYLFNEGIKVSKIYREDGSLVYWYCDIVSYDYSSTDNRLMVTDLLADVIIYPDGFVKVVDLDELVTALESRAITLDTLKSCLNRLDRLLKLIYSGGFSELTSHIEKYAVQ